MVKSRQNSKKTKSKVLNIVKEDVNETDVTEIDDRKDIEEETLIRNIQTDDASFLLNQVDLVIDKETLAVDSDNNVNQIDEKLTVDSDNNVNQIDKKLFECSDNNILTIVATPPPQNQKPKLRCLSLKKRRYGLTDDQNASSPKRSCFDSSEIIKPKAVFIAPGLKNLGNSCYMNSALQVLYYTPHFRYFINSLSMKIANHEASSTYQTSFIGWEKIELVKNLKRLFDEMCGCSSIDNSVIDPCYVFGIIELLNPEFRSGDQQDVHEFMTDILSHLQDAENVVNKWKQMENNPSASKEKLSDPINPGGSTVENTLISSQPKTVASNSVGISADVSISSRNKDDDDGLSVSKNSLIESQSESVYKAGIGTNFVADVFQGTLERVTRCMECENESKRSETFQDLPLCLRSAKQVPTKLLQFQKNNDPTFTNFSDDEEEDDDDSSHMLKSLSSIEKLESDNKFHCFTCNHLVEAEIRTCFIDSPQVLIIYLQRFTQFQSFGGMGMFSKMTENIGIPLEMNCLEENCTSQHRLRLFAVISHSGYSLNSGHYLAYIKEFVTPKQTPPPNSNQKIIPNDVIGEPRHPRINSSGDKISDDGRVSSSLSTDDQESNWLEINDHLVKRLTSKDIEKITRPRSTSNNPYMLFYTRITF